MKVLTTTSEVIDALGGNKPVKDLTKRTVDSAVSNWRKIGKFPPDTHHVLKWALGERGCTAPDALWQQVELPQAAAK